MNAIHYVFAATLTAVFAIFFIVLISRLIKGAIAIGDDENEPEYIEDDLKEYFFCYADNKRYPYKAGWTRVLAPDLEGAEAVFRVFHPDTIEGLTSCAVIYDGLMFRQTNIFATGNYGEFEHETITASRMTIAQKEVTPCRPES